MKRIAALAMWVPLLWAQADRPAARTVTAVRHWTLGDVTRVAVEVSADFKFHAEHLHSPERVYFDILDARALIGQHRLYTEALDDDHRVNRVRVAEPLPGVTRIVLDLAGPSDVTTSQLANPDRLVIEVRSSTGPGAGSTVTPAAPENTDPVPPRPDPAKAAPFIPPPTRQVKAIVAPDLASAEMVIAEPSKSELAPSVPAKPDDAAKNPALEGSSSDSPGGAVGSTPWAPARHDSTDTGKAAHRDTAAGNPPPARTTDAAGPARYDSTAAVPGATAGTAHRDSTISSPTPTAPAATSAASAATLLAETGKAARHTIGGDNSLIRELGLKISRVVIDPGHGGHDQGTQGAKGLQEKELVLDVAKRVGKLIEDKMGAEVIYTRTDDTFIPLERRTALANEKRADLFLSIHANSSSVARITGVETYYLNFADTKDAMDVAARENAAAHGSIFELRDIVQKITMHDKAEESKEFASRMQTSLYAFSAHEIPGTKNRGVKKAPFVVLIGAQMPSILAEIGFLSNPREEILLKRPDYRQKLADALFRGVQRYADGLSHFQVAQQTQNQP